MTNETALFYIETWKSSSDCIYSVFGTVFLNKIFHLFEQIMKWNETNNLTLTEVWVVGTSQWAGTGNGCPRGWGQAFSGAESLRVHSFMNTFNPSHTLAIWPHFKCILRCNNPTFTIKHQHAIKM